MSNSSPGLYNGQVPTAAQWNSYFSTKQDWTPLLDGIIAGTSPSTNIIGPSVGGTGLGTFTTGAILYASSTSVLTLLAAGANGYVLTLAGGLPTWAAAGAGTVTSVAVSGGTTGLTTSGGPITGAGTITFAGTLATANGGTGLTTFTAANNAIYSSAAGTLAAGTLPILAGGTGSTTQNFVDLSSTQAAIAGTKTFTGQLIGKGTQTNNNAAAGYIGETGTVAVSSGSAVSLTTGTPATIVSYTLGPGDFLVWGQLTFTGGASTTVNYAQASLDGAIATQSDFYAAGVTYFATVNGSGFSMVTAPLRYSIAVSQTVTVKARAAFGVSTMAAYGNLYWMRIR